MTRPISSALRARALPAHALLATLFAALLFTTGCGKFFPRISGGGGGTGCTVNCTTTDFLYVANQNTAAASLGGFSIVSAALKAVPSSPFPLAVLPTALAINPANTFLYVGSAQGQLYLYTINSDGSLTAANAGNPVETIPAASMQVDSTGNWLLVANALNATVSVFAINSTTGLLTVPTAGATTALNAGVGTPSRLVITTDNTTVYVSLNTSGVEVLTFAATTGVLTDQGNLPTRGGQNSDGGLAVDHASPSRFLFVTETGVNAVRVLAIGASGHLTEVAGSPFPTGLGPSAILVDATGSYVYVTNRFANTISAFLLTNSGSLTAIAGSPFATGTTPGAIVEDKSKTYVAVTSQGGTPDLQLFTLDATTPGKLDPFASASTGTDPAVPATIAATH